MKYCVGGAIIALALSTSALAQTQAYSRAEHCTSYQLAGEPVWETACPGQGAWSVYYHASEHGEAVAYAFEGSERSEFRSSPDRGLFGGYNDTIEWRLNDAGPFATIHRYVGQMPVDGQFTEDGAPVFEEQHTLIVTALRPGQMPVACQMAFIDASVHANANEIAQAVADGLSEQYSCEGEHPYQIHEGMAQVEALIAAKTQNSN